jgi:hypothetical protein
MIASSPYWRTTWTAGTMDGFARRSNCGAFSLTAGKAGKNRWYPAAFVAASRTPHWLIG